MAATANIIIDTYTVVSTRFWTGVQHTLSFRHTCMYLSMVSNSFYMFCIDEMGLEPSNLDDKMSSLFLLTHIHIYSCFPSIPKVLFYAILSQGTYSFPQELQSIIQFQENKLEETEDIFKILDSSYSKGLSKCSIRFLSYAYIYLFTYLLIYLLIVQSFTGRVR